MTENSCDTKRPLSRHPLTVVVVAFALSGVLGTIFSSWIKKSYEETQHFRMESESRKSAVQNFSRFVYKRRARAEMLASSFRRRAPLEEIKERKKLYDEEYVQWNANHQSNLFLIREVLAEDKYSYFEHVVEFLLVGKIFSPLDKCLTDAYDAILLEEDAVAILDRCSARDLIQLSLDCGYVITDELFKLSGGYATQPEAALEISDRCPD